jgi:hypothetical protein
MQMKIREKSIALFILCAVVPLCVVSMGSYFYARNALSGFVDAELTLGTREALNGLERQFSEGLIDLRSWSKLRVMQDVLIGDEENEISDELAKLREQYPFYATNWPSFANSIRSMSSCWSSTGRERSLRPHAWRTTERTCPEPSSSR